MKYLLSLSILFLFSNAYTQPLFELSQNIYRVPYAAGTTIAVGSDHLTHSPQGRYDMSGYGNGSSCSNNYPIVAAAEGIIRRIEDDNNVKPPGCDPDCQDFNNYVWIEHANGEWSKYSHMKQFSTTVDAGLQVGDQVCAGTFLGYECDIGQASGPHLHFEVRRPLNPANIQISVLGGFMSNADHLIPVINSLSKHCFDGGDNITASSSNACINANVSIAGAQAFGNNIIKIYMASTDISMQAIAVLSYQNGSNGLMQAGNSITLGTGFTAAAGSSFEAKIGSCATTNLAGTCQ